MGLFVLQPKNIPDYDLFHPLTLFVSFFFLFSSHLPWFSLTQRIISSGYFLLIYELGPEIALQTINTWPIDFHSIRTEVIGLTAHCHRSFHVVRQIWGPVAGNLQFLFLSCLKYLRYFLFIRSTWDLNGNLRNNSNTQNQRFKLWV